MDTPVSADKHCVDTGYSLKDIEWWLIETDCEKESKESVHLEDYGVDRVVYLW